MKLDKKLLDWEARGFIDATQRARIEEYEAAHARPVLLYAIGGLGAFTIGIGIISIVAANWDGIGKVAKLGLDLALLAGLGAGLFLAQREGRRITVEVLAGVYYLLSLASIALLGQIYQLGSPTYQAFVFWTVISFPFMSLVRGRLLGLVWLAGLVGTEWAALWELADVLEATRGAQFMHETVVALVVPAWLLPFGLAHLPLFARDRPEVARAWIESLWLGFLFAGLCFACVFYSEVLDADRVRWGQLVLVGALVALGLALPKLYRDMPGAARGALLAGVGLVACCAVFGISFARDQLPAIAALFQIALLACAAFASLRLGSQRGFNAFTGLIALRVLFGYFELFGSMLTTGIGMIMGGAFTLLVAWLWKRKAPELAARLREGGDHVA